MASLEGCGPDARPERDRRPSRLGATRLAPQDDSRFRGFRNDERNSRYALAARFGEAA